MGKHLQSICWMKVLHHVSSVPKTGMASRPPKPTFSRGGRDSEPCWQGSMVGDGKGRWGPGGEGAVFTGRSETP